MRLLSAICTPHILYSSYLCYFMLALFYLICLFYFILFYLVLSPLFHNCCTAISLGINKVSWILNLESNPSVTGSTFNLNWWIKFYKFISTTTTSSKVKYWFYTEKYTLPDITFQAYILILSYQEEIYKQYTLWLKHV